MPVRLTVLPSELSEAARAAGIAFGAVTWGYTTGEALRARRPEEVFETLAEIVDTATSASAAN